MKHFRGNHQGDTEYMEMETFSSEMQPKGYREVGSSPRICNEPYVMFMRYIWCLFFLDFRFYLFYFIGGVHYRSAIRHVYAVHLVSFFFTSGFIRFTSLVVRVILLQCKTARVIVHLTVQLLPVSAIPCARYCDMQIPCVLMAGR